MSHEARSRYYRVGDPVSSRSPMILLIEGEKKFTQTAIEAIFVAMIGVAFWAVFILPWIENSLTEVGL